MKYVSRQAERKAETEARAAEALRLKESGLTLREVGKRLDPPLTAEPVRRLIGIAERRQNNEGGPDQSLTVRAANVLRFAGLNTKEDVAEALESGAITYRKGQHGLSIPNCGRRTSDEILEWAGIKL